ncbi:MAG: hypothetical protein IAF58_08955, partial [Leptolyngbya sp.]|nr:hypothetical protein [Candidatus Melainabacteria bacterium]
MLKLYKQIQEKIYYWQAWEQGTDVLLHWGEVGQRGEHQTIPLIAGENAEDILLRESAPQVNQGFAEIEPVSLLAIEFVCEGTGSPADLKKSGEIEYLTNQFLGWTGNGFCDGNEIADGTLTVFCCVMDRQIAADMTIACLRAAQLLDGVKIQSIANVEDDSEVPFIHWPEATQAVSAEAVAPVVLPETQSLPEFAATSEAERQPNHDVEAHPIEQQKENETPNAELETEEEEEE